MEDKNKIRMAEYYAKNQDKLKELARLRRQSDPQKALETKRKYAFSEKGKAAKKRADDAYKVSGGRAGVEARRAAKPISEARKQCRLAYQLARRSGEKLLDDFSSWVLHEAVHLAALRTQTLGCKWHVDHIVPVSKGGGSQYDNLQVVPAYWNRKKSNKHTEHFFARA
jgi:5-methylcytosine-specific restriction endonuclease McrA